MRMTRRISLQLALTGIAMGGLPRIGAAEDAAPATVSIRPIEHASFYLELPDRVIAVDPVGDAALYANLPQPDLILITHEHGDHFDPDRLQALLGEQTRIISNPAVLEKMSDALKARTTAMANGETADLDGLMISAVPAYNITEDRLQYHPKGRDNGYVLTIGGARFYIAGDTEATDEMKALTDIHVAFVPMNLPYTMTADQAAEGVAAFAPVQVYPYHHRGTDPAAFAAKLKELGSETEVIIADWYPAVEDPTGANPE
ncbi:MBL fold metallo-hydrolase [Paracoccus sp. DMF-8]|uniref:MBL fold metallo-hydrolase n=1 Tax=Paracoccus sp. DMF-8 TaxID=3019445 RepID=UPI0023E7F921|nr:MBL fold metallo-hydrolase [Paracoccus sp. DMF-8]MDF3604792.1 MBL fold metallo-hydrolase [Paracoccus sp. DMF-8]